MASFTCNSRISFPLSSPKDYNLPNNFILHCILVILSVNDVDNSKFIGKTYFVEPKLTRTYLLFLAEIHNFL